MENKIKKKPKPNIPYLTDYNKKHYKSYIIKVRIGRDDDVINRLNEVESKNGYIRSLIKKDIHGKRWKEEN